MKKEFVQFPVFIKSVSRRIWNKSSTIPGNGKTDGYIPQPFFLHTITACLFFGPTLEDLFSKNDFLVCITFFSILQDSSALLRHFFG